MNIKATAILAAACLVTGCGSSSGSSGSSAPPPTSNADPGGIWTGIDSGTGLAVTALITESGQVQVIRSDGAQYFGSLTVSGANAISGTVDGIAPYGGSFPDGSIHGTGKVTGTLAAGSTIQATVTFTTDRGELSTGSATLTFQSIYNNKPNVADFAGTWTDANSGLVAPITSGGVIFAQDPVTGCVLNGRINVVQGNYNLWSASIDYANCAGSAANLNGLEFAGFIEINGNQILAGFRDKAGKNYGIVFSLTKQ